MTLESCSLCGQERKLRVSHIIPKFVGKWLKETSATGFMMRAQEPRERIQDLPTLPLLCSDCEEKFSKLETYFSNQIFWPFHKKGIKSFKYDERLELFIVSLSWRTIKVSYDDLKKEEPQMCSYVDKAEYEWRNFLLDKRNDVKPYENHIFFWDYIKDGKDIPSRFQWYTLRAVDANLAGNKKRIFAYTKFPWIVFVTSIHPTTLDGWYDTKVDRKGTISTPQRIEDGLFGQFIVDRAKLALGDYLPPSSEWRKKETLESY